jgi:putative hemin transport protein
MGVSEAELVATGCGEHVTRLDGGWNALLSELETLGPVMALTRNDAAVHEKTGVYRNVEFTETHNMGLVLDDDIDLRLFMGHWHLGFAVEAPWDGGRDGVRRSLQFFDRDGTAVHKVFLTRESDLDAYDALVDTYRHDDQSIEQSIRPTEDDPAETPIEKIDVEGFLREWGELEDTHDFFPLLREYEEMIDQAWVVKKPTTDGTVTSLELTDAEGGIIARLFGKRKPGEPEREDWRAILAALPSEP